MRRRAVVLCALLAAALAGGVLAGCGGGQVEDTTSGTLTLTIYTAGALHGDAGPETQDAADAVKLALRQANGMVGPFTLQTVSLDDTDPKTGRWGADQVITNARRAISDRNVMAFIGLGDSGAAALTLPLLNEAGVLQVGATAGYVGLTRQAGRGEPERFYPSGLRTFGRIAPADDVQARALLAEMHRQGVTRLALLHDGELEALGLAELLTREAGAAGIRVVTEKAVDDDGADPSGVASDVASSGADGAIYAGTDARTGARVLDALHEADPSLELFAPSGLATAAFARDVDADTARRLLVTSPAVPLADLSPEARRFGEAFHQAFGRDPAPGAVFGYEAMRAVMAAVRKAGVKGNDRTAIINAYLGLRDLPGPLGTWSVGAGGDSTVRRYGIWRVAAGRLDFVRQAREST